MLVITFEEAAAFAQPDGLPRREADLFWRAARLVRKAAGQGSDPAALIATESGDLEPGSAFLAYVGLDHSPAEALLERAVRVRYTLRVHAYEVELDAPRAIVLLPRDVLTDGLKAELHLGHAPVTVVPCAALGEEIDALRAHGAQVRWTSLRHSARDVPGYHLRVRLGLGRACRELRTHLPLDAAPDAAAVSRFLREHVGAGVRSI
jgi:hypothetical protein